MKRTHCPHGHALTPANLYLHTDGYRICLTCKREASREYQRRLRQTPGYAVVKKMLRRKYRRARA